MLTFRAEGMARDMQLLESHPLLPPDVAAPTSSNKASFLRLEGRTAEAKALLREAMAIAPEEDLYTQVSIKEQMAVPLFEHEDVGAAIKLLREKRGPGPTDGPLFYGPDDQGVTGCFYHFWAGPSAPGGPNL